MILVRSLLFKLIMWSSVLIYAPLGILTFPFPYHFRYAFISGWPRFHVWLLKILCGIRYEVKGRENLPKGSAIVMAKHQSTWETFAFTFLFPPQTWVLKRELTWIPLFGWALAMLKPIAIDRSSGKQAMAQLIDQGRERLQSGIWVVVFPEGTRIPTGKRGRYKLGGAVLAAETGYPVVPVAHNAGSVWPRRSALIYPGTVRVVIGKPIDTHGRQAEAIRNQAEEWIEKTMQELEGRDGPAEPV